MQVAKQVTDDAIGMFIQDLITDITAKKRMEKIRARAELMAEEERRAAMQVCMASHQISLFSIDGWCENHHESCCNSLFLVATLLRWL